jgi:hypothetical protein
MSPLVYCVGGSVGPQMAYVVRKADEAAHKALSSRHYVLVCAPRQQGKSSLLKRLVKRLSPHVVCSLDLEEFRGGSEETWYEDLFSYLGELAGPVVGTEQFNALPHSYRGFRELLRMLEENLERQGRLMDILIDEVSWCPPWGRQFFAGIRAHHERTASKDDLRRVTFLFAGAFVPSELISGNNSPFNVGDSIVLADFTEEEVLELVAHGPWQSDEQSALAQAIHGWTGGQPFMTQWFCDHLAQRPEPGVATVVDECARTFLLHDKIHLPSLRNRLEQDEGAIDYVRRVAGEGRMPLVTSKLHDRLESVYGIVKPEGRSWVIRNRVYQEAFRSEEEKRRPPPQIFISYSHQDRDDKTRRALNPIQSFEVFLKPLKANGLLYHWIDHQQISSGRFDPVIRKAIRSSRLAVLFVSPNYLGSDYVAEVEIPEIFRAADENALEVLVVELAPSNVGHTQLKDFHFFNRNGPLNGIREQIKLDAVLKELCEKILVSIRKMMGVTPL